MSKGYEKNKERKVELSYFGKDLVRRSKSMCELCETSGTKLEIFELPPVPASPNFDRCMLLCEKCKQQTKNPDDFNHLRCLSNSVWSEVPAVAALSIRLLNLLKDDHSFASELLDQIYPDEDTLTLV